MKPAENPLSTEGIATGTRKSGYSQDDLHKPFTAREVPRSLPFSEDGEKGVLCSLLLSPRDVADICVLHLRSDAFYIPAHEIIYNLVLEFGEKRKPIDFVSLKQALKDRNQLEEIGGPEYLSDLYDFVPTAANARLLHRYRPREVRPAPVDLHLQQAFNSVLRSTGRNRTAVG